jgi:hypothetical protein
MIERLSPFPDNVCAFVCHGHVTREEYTSVLVPAVEAAFEKHDKLRLYYETGPDFTGIDPTAVWQDTATGLRHFFGRRHRRRLDQEHLPILHCPHAGPDEGLRRRPRRRGPPLDRRRLTRIRPTLRKHTE